MVCPPVRGDNPRALSSGLSPVQPVGQTIVYLFYTTLASVDLAQNEIFRAKICDFWQGRYKGFFLFQASLAPLYIAVHFAFCDFSVVYEIDLYLSYMASWARLFKTNDIVS